MKAALMTPLVSSLALTWGKAVSQHIYLTASSGEKQAETSWLCSSPQRCGTLHLKTHIEIKEGVHLVLNNGDRLEQLLCIHGPHHAVHSVWRVGAGEGTEDRGKTERRASEQSSAAAKTPQQPPHCCYTWEVLQGYKVMPSRSFFCPILSPDQPNF